MERNLSRALCTLLVACSGSLIGCATNNPAFQQVAENAKGIRGATSCCTSLNAAIAGAKELRPEQLSFSPSTPHFDFGEGVAPFVVYAIQPSVKVLEFEAQLQLVGFAYGGDGTGRYVDAQAIFFDADGQRLTAKLLDRSQRFTGPGMRSLISYVSVPASAKTMVLTTNPRKNGESDMGPIRNALSKELTSSSTEFFAWGGIMPSGYKLANYGPLKVRVLPNQ